jgi:hypothetical protein
MALGDHCVVCLVHLQAVTPLFLRQETRRISGTQGRRKITVLCNDRDDTDAHPNLKCLVFPEETVLLEDTAQFLHDLAGIVYRAILQDEAKLISPKTAQDIGMADGGAEKRGELLQELVAGGMATGIIDDLKLIEVEITQDMLAVFSFRPVEGLYETGLEGMPIDQASERIVSRLVGHLVGHSHNFGDIAKDEHRSDQAPPPLAESRRHRT